MGTSKTSYMRVCSKMSSPPCPGCGKRGKNRKCDPCDEDIANVAVSGSASGSGSVSGSASGSDTASGSGSASAEETEAAAASRSPASLFTLAFSSGCFIISRNDHKAGKDSP